MIPGFSPCGALSQVLAGSGCREVEPAAWLWAWVYANLAISVRASVEGLLGGVGCVLGCVGWVLMVKSGVSARCCLLSCGFAFSPSKCWGT